MTESTTINIKPEPIEADNHINTSLPVTTETMPTATYIQVKSEEEVYDAVPATDSFVIYEFDETLIPPHTGTPTLAEVYTKSVALPSIEPLIINTKFHKKRKITSNSMATPTPAKKVAKEPLQQIADVLNVAKPTTSSIVTATPPLISTQNPELKVKCLCRLENTYSSISNGMELKNFFEEMFEVTRQLSRSQQRDVKLTLLEAISEAEEYVDAGRWCEKCCS